MAVEESADEAEDYIESAVVFWFKHAAYAVMGEEAVTGVGSARRGKDDLEAGSGGPLLKSSDQGVDVLEDGEQNGKERTLEMEGAGRGEERLWTETFDGGELDEPGDTEKKTVEEFVLEEIVRGEMSEDVSELVGLKD